MNTAAPPFSEVLSEPLHLIHQLTELVSQHADLDTALNFVFDNFQSLVCYDRIGYAIVDMERDRIVARWVKSTGAVKLRPGFSGRVTGSSLHEVLQDKKPRILADLADYLRDHPDSDSTRLVVEEGMRSSLTCPLTVDGRPIGLLFFSSREPGQYSVRNIELIEEIADHLALLLERAQWQDQVRTVRESLANEHERFEVAVHAARASEHERSLGIVLKKSLFPAGLPQPDGYHLAVQFQPARDCGGCLLDVMPLPGDRWGIVAADCSNHGHRSYMLMAILHAIVRLTTWETFSAASILAQLSDLVAKVFPHGSFASALVAIFDPEQGTVHWANAGFPAPLLLRSSGYVLETVAPLAKSVAGTESTLLFDTDSMPLGPGDKFLLCSPGLLRAHFRDHAPFGTEQLQQALREHSQASARDLLDHVWAALQHALQGEDPTEDTMLLAIERLPQNVACLPDRGPDSCRWRQGWVVCSTSVVADH